MTTRTFLAVELSDDARKLLARRIATLSRALPGVRFVDPAGIHLTLAFLGELDDDQLAAATAAAQHAATDAHSFALRIGGLGTFGPPYAPRVVWAGVSGDLRELHTLQDTLAGELERRGFPREARPFSPHLTLARLKQRLDPAALAALQSAVNATTAPAASMPVTHLSVMKSELARAGASYTCLHAFPLGG